MSGRRALFHLGSIRKFLDKRLKPLVAQAADDFSGRFLAFHIPHVIVLLLLVGCNMPLGGPPEIPRPVTPEPLPPEPITPAVTGTPARTPGPIPLPYTILTPIAVTPGAAPPSPTPDPFAGQPYQDARALFDGVCFDYWVQQVNRVYVIGTAFEHIAFYNEVDESGLCRFPVVRHPFDFEEGRILVGAVNIGTGCWAATVPLALVTDDEARTVTLRVEWAVSGDCDYRLARPFFVSLPRPPEGYRVTMAFVPLEDDE